MKYTITDETKGNDITLIMTNSICNNVLFDVVQNITDVEKSDLLEKCFELMNKKQKQDLLNIMYNLTHQTELYNALAYNEVLED